LNDPECIYNQIQRENADEGGEERDLVKGGNPWRRKKQESRNQKTNQDIEIKNRTLVQMASVLFLDQCRTKTTVDERLGNGHEDRQHRDQAELLRQKQPGQNYRSEKLDPLLPNALEEAPIQPFDRIVLYVGFHFCRRKVNSPDQMLPTWRFVYIYRVFIQTIVMPDYKVTTYMFCKKCR